MAFDDNGSCLLTGGHDGRVKLWNLSTGKLLKEMVRPDKLENDLREVTALLFRSTLAGSYIISGGWDRKVTMWADEERHDVLDTHIPKQKCYRQVSKHHEFCIENEELCIENEELCIKNEDFCIKKDEFCSWRAILLTFAAWRFTSRTH